MTDRHVRPPAGQNDTGQRVKAAARSAWIAVKDRAVGVIYGRGFDDAASLCLEVVQERIAALRSQISSGSLAKQDQLLLDTLAKVELEMLEKLREPNEEARRGRTERHA
jgi:hypothetical protein